MVEMLDKRTWMWHELEHCLKTDRCCQDTPCLASWCPGGGLLDTLSLRIGAVQSPYLFLAERRLTLIIIELESLNFDLVSRARIDLP